MPYTKESLATVYNLSPEEVEHTLLACDLPLQKAEYNDDEIDSRFKLIRSYFDQQRVDNYQAAMNLLRDELAPQQLESNAKEKKPIKGKKTPGPMTLSHMLVITSEQIGSRVSLIQAGQLLEACGLREREDDSYPDEEVARFVEACDMHLRLGKPLAEVAAHFDVPVDSHAEVLELLEQMSGNQIEELKASLIQAKQQQNQQFIEAFHRMTIQKLRQQAESGELQAQLQQAWSGRPVGNGFNLLAQVEARMENQKRLPGS